MTIAKRTDSNHGQIRDALRRLGVKVFDVHALPGALDLLAQTRSGRLVLLEVKSGPTEPLTAKEEATFALFAGNCYRVQTAEQAIDICFDESED